MAHHKTWKAEKVAELRQEEGQEEVLQDKADEAEARKHQEYDDYPWHHFDEEILRGGELVFFYGRPSGGRLLERKEDGGEEREEEV